MPSFSSLGLGHTSSAGIHWCFHHTSSQAWFDNFCWSLVQAVTIVDPATLCTLVDMYQRDVFLYVQTRHGLTPRCAMQIKNAWPCSDSKNSHKCWWCKLLRNRAKVRILNKAHHNQ
jgi:hypothetical protein